MKLTSKIVALVIVPVMSPAMTANEAAIEALSKTELGKKVEKSANKIVETIPYGKDGAVAIAAIANSVVKQSLTTENFNTSSTLGGFKIRPDVRYSLKDQDVSATIKLEKRF